MITSNQSNILVDFLKTSTPENRRQARSISKFISKIMSTSPNSTLEEQLSVLRDYFHLNDTDIKHTKNDMPNYIVHFIDCLCKGFYDLNAEHFKALEEKEPLNIILGIMIAERIFSSGSTDQKEEWEVYSIYTKIVDDYQAHVENYIIDNNRFDLTNNSEEIFRLYLQTKTEYSQKTANRNLATVWDKFSEHVDEYSQVITNLQQKNLDKFNVEELIQKFLVDETTLVAISLKNSPVQNVGIIEGLNDENSLKKLIGTIDKIETSVSLTDKQHKILEDNKRILTNLIPTQASGCLGVMLAIIGLSSLMTWGISTFII